MTLSPVLSAVIIASGDQFSSIALVLATAAVVAFIAHRASQPLIVAFIIGGILVGPSVSDRLRLQAGVDRGVIDLILQPFDNAADDAIAAMAHED